MDFVPRAIVENAAIGRAIEEDAELAAASGLSRVAVAASIATALRETALVSFATRAFSAAFSALASFCLRARAIAAALVATAAAIAPGILARTLAATRGAPAAVEILLAFFVNAARERRAAIDERPDLLDLHAGRPEPMSGLLVLRDNLHSCVESLSRAELDGPVGSSGLVRAADETEIRRVAHGGAAAVADVHEIVAHRLKRAPAPLAGDVERAQESIPADEENFQELKIDVVERDIAHQCRGSGDNGNRDAGGQFETASGLRTP